MIDPKKLTKKDEGRRVRYHPNHEPEFKARQTTNTFIPPSERGRIKAFTDKYIFVHFDGGGDTAKACYPENLEWADSLLDLPSEELFRQAKRDLEEVFNDKS